MSAKQGVMVLILSNIQNRPHPSHNNRRMPRKMIVRYSSVKRLLTLLADRNLPKTACGLQNMRSIPKVKKTRKYCVHYVV